MLTAMEEVLTLKRRAALDDEDDDPTEASLGDMKGDECDEVRLEQQVAYRKRMGRWRRETINVLADPFFGRMATTLN